LFISLSEKFPQWQHFPNLMPKRSHSPPESRKFSLSMHDLRDSLVLLLNRSSLESPLPCSFRNHRHSSTTAKTTERRGFPKRRSTKRVYFREATGLPKKRRIPGRTQRARKSATHYVYTLVYPYRTSHNPCSWLTVQIRKFAQSSLGATKARRSQWFSVPVSGRYRSNLTNRSHLRLDPNTVEGHFLRQVLLPERFPRKFASLKASSREPLFDSKYPMA